MATILQTGSELFRAADVAKARWVRAMGHGPRPTTEEGGEIIWGETEEEFFERINGLLAEYRDLEAQAIRACAEESGDPVALHFINSREVR